MFKSKSPTRRTLWLIVFAGLVYSVAQRPERLAGVLSYIWSIISCVAAGLFVAFVLNLIMVPIEHGMGKLFKKAKPGLKRGISVSVTYIIAVALIAMMVMFREEPKLEDIMISALPLVSVLLPGMCMLGLQKAPGRLNQNLLMVLAFGVPLSGDTAAYFIGSRFGKRKLCPAVSPNKSIEGAAAGLVTSVLFALLCKGVASFFGPTPPWWHFPVLGFIGGVAGQLGDLFASLIKRHCGIKDFSNIFPGHGGMMDRLDSVYWATVVMYIYLNLTLYMA